MFEIGRNVLEFSTETNVALTEGKATKRQPSCQPLRSPQERFWCLGTCEARCAVMASPAAPFLGLGCIGCIGCIGCWPLLATAGHERRCPRVPQLLNGDLDTCNLPRCPQVPVKRHSHKANITGYMHQISASGPSACFKFSIWSRFHGMSPMGHTSIPLKSVI